MPIATRLCFLFAAALLACGQVFAAEGGARQAVGSAAAPFETFLDRLMRAESGGNDLSSNSRSTALGPFQFLKTTFLEVTRRHFGAEIAALADEDVLLLRTDREFARRAAAVHSMENLAHLTEQGFTGTFGELRLAHLVGASGALRLLQSEAQTPAAVLLGGLVLKANPFMSGMSASDLISRAAREVSEPVAPSIAQAQRPRLRTAAARPEPTERPSAAGLPPGVVVRCNQKLVVCRRWIAMQINKQRVAELAAKQGPRNAGRRLPGRASGRPGA